MHLKSSLSFLFASALTISTFTACVDNNYDLADIDTTAKLSVNELVIPINLDEITLDNIINLNDQDKIKIVDGRYVIEQTGSFSSDAIMIERATLTIPKINPTVDVISLIPNTQVRTNSSDDELGALASFTYDLQTKHSQLEYTTSAMSQSIMDIDYVGCDMDFTVNIDITGLKGIAERIEFQNVVLQFPKGLDFVDDSNESYDPATGLLQIGSHTVNGTNLSLSFKAKGIDFDTADATFNPEDHTLSVKGALYIQSGKINIDIDDINIDSSIPQEVQITTSYTLSNATLTKFTGKLQYALNKAKLTDVSLSGLPDLLAQNGTNIRLANPCIYLNIVNPLQQYDIFARTGLTITAHHATDNTTQSYSLDDNYFTIGRPVNNSGNYNFCLSPDAPATPAEDFPDAAHVPFSALSDVLSGNGIPQRLSFTLDNPMLPEQQVTDFRLGQQFNAMTGKYKFITALQFLEGTQIQYHRIIDGWYSDDIEDLTIEQLEVTLKVNSDLPVGAKFSGYPIDKNGKQINNVDIVGADIPANAKDAEVKLHITGEITGLDGIEFVVTAMATDGSPLSPDMKIHLSEIRPKVSGYYLKEL